MHIKGFLIIVFLVCCLVCLLYLERKRKRKPKSQVGGISIKCDQDFEVIDNISNELDGTGIIIKGGELPIVLRDNALVDDKKAAN